MAAITYIKDSIDLQKLNISESAMAEFGKLFQAGTEDDNI
jgi:hypothetical protein